MNRFEGAKYNPSVDFGLTSFLLIPFLIDEEICQPLDLALPLDEKKNLLYTSAHRSPCPLLCMKKSYSIGPCTQILTLEELPHRGSVSDCALRLVTDSFLTIEKGKIVHIGKRQAADEEIPLTSPSVATPGLIDAHTHICWAGSRFRDYALRLQGKSYQEIASQGGGILDTVQHTRAATQEELACGVVERCHALLKRGITTVEVKSGYGLSVESELKMLRAIQQAQKSTPLQLVPTCLAAHTKPWEWESHDAYLQHIANTLLPQVKEEALAHRVDIFIEEGAFSLAQGEHYLKLAASMGFDLTVHGDQFSRGSCSLASSVHPLSIDHLEASLPQDLEMLVGTSTSPIMLPGASLGLGLPFAPARAALDLGLSLAIASDWNPGSAPMGDLLTQAALMGAAQKLTQAETWAAITYRAAIALGLHDRGQLKPGFRADFLLFPCQDYRAILYHQGALKPSHSFTSERGMIPLIP